VTITATCRRTRSGRQRRQAHRIGPRPMVLNRDVLAFDVAGFVEALRNASTERAEALGEPPYRHSVARR
jgi:hypothetical protein